MSVGLEGSYAHPIPPAPHYVGGFDLAKPVANAGSSYSLFTQGAKSGSAGGILRAQVPTPAGGFLRGHRVGGKSMATPRAAELSPTSAEAARPALLVRFLGKFWEI